MKQFIIATKAGLGTMLGIGLLALSQSIFTAWDWLIAPFGASAVLLFGLPDSPLARPLNVIGGHVVTAIIGLIFAHYVGVCPWSLALATGLAVSMMVLTSTVHPPAGANPILVMLSRADWGFVLEPLLIGTVCLVLVAKAYGKLNFVLPKMLKKQIKGASE